MEITRNNTKSREKNYDRGLRIAERRKQLGLSQDELAHRIGIGRQALSAIENGGEFKSHTLEQLVVVLGVSEKYIMSGEADNGKEKLISEAVDVMSDMDEMMIKQFIAMMRAAKKVEAQD